MRGAVGGEWDVAPASNEVVRIVGSQIRHNSAGLRLEAMLSWLQMGCYEDGRGNYWFGPTDETATHEHDRWHYLVPKLALDAESNWYRMRFRPLIGCGAEYVGTSVDFLARLESTVKWLEPFLVDINPLAILPPSDLTREELSAQVELANRLMHLNRLTYRPAKDQVQALLRANVHPALLHELLYHFDAWAATNDAGEMPQDMVLRMHGLGVYVDARQAGHDWFKG